MAAGFRPMIVTYEIFSANDDSIKCESSLQSEFLVDAVSAPTPKAQQRHVRFHSSTDRELPTSILKMNSPSSSSSTASGNDLPLFQTQSTLDDELQLEFAPSPSAGAVFTAESDALSSPVTQYRDAPFEFTTSAFDHLDALDNLSFFPTSKQPLQQQRKQATASPLSPSGAVEVPVKEGWDSVFSAAYPSFPSTATPDKIMASLQTALTPFECAVRVENRWTLRVSWLCVAEEIAFNISLAQEQGHSTRQYEVSFRREFGDEAVFLQLVECVRARCSDVDLEPLFFAESTLEPWLDAKQELKGRRYAIADTEAAQLIKEMNAQLDAETLYEVVKMVKNHCRHRGNRRLFLEADRSGFVQALKSMLADSEVLARFAVFILLQFAKESCEDGSGDIFSSAFERNSIELLLSELETREQDSTCAQFTLPMLSEIQQSWIFA